MSINLTFFYFIFLFVEWYLSYLIVLICKGISEVINIIPVFYSVLQIIGLCYQFKTLLLQVTFDWEGGIDIVF